MPKKKKEQKFFAINWKDSGEIWVKTYFCEEKLSKNDNQLILTEAEAKTLTMYLIAEFLK